MTEEVSLPVESVQHTVTRRFTPEEKAEVILLGLRNPGRVAEICRDHKVSPISFSRWKKKFVSGGLEALRKHREATSYELQKENAMLKEAVGRLYVELEYLKKKLEAVR